MRIGIHFAPSVLVLGSILVSAAGIHARWWRTVASTIDQQIAAATEQEIAAIVTEAGSAHTALPRSGA